MSLIKKKKVLVFLQSGVGGAERVSVIIGKSLDRTMFDVTFCLIGDTTGYLSIENFIPQDYPIVRIPRVKGLKLFWTLKKMIAKEKPNVVFSSVMHVNTKLLAASFFFRKIKFVIRNNNYLYTLSAIQKMILRVFYRFADSVIAQTDEMANELILQVGLPKAKVHALQNPIDKQFIDEKAKEISPYKNHEKVVYVASGRFHRVKGFDILVRAFKLVLAQQPNAELHILGKITENCADYYNEVFRIIKQLNMEQQIVFEGFLQNPYVFVKNADCFVLSSRNEGLPNVLIESLYLGTPVAATKCIPVISRIVREGVDGFLAEPENVESLASSMLLASKLGRVSSTYCSAAVSEFQRVFEDD